MAKGKLVCLTGPAGAGKDTLAVELMAFLSQRNYRIDLLSGSAFFRTAAAYVVSSGYDGKKPLPINFWNDIQVQTLREGEEVVGEILVRDTIAGRYYPCDYMQIEVGNIGSNLAQQPATGYKEFVLSSIRKQIRANSERGIHTLFPARDSFALAASLDSEVETWCGYIDASIEVRTKRLRERYENIGNETIVDQKVRGELQRDEQDLRSGTLPLKSDLFIDVIKGRERQHDEESTARIPYYFDTSDLTIEMAVTNLVRVLQDFL